MFTVSKQPRQAPSRNPRGRLSFPRTLDLTRANDQTNQTRGEGREKEERGGSRTLTIIPLPYLTWLSHSHIFPPSVDNTYLPPKLGADPTYYLADHHFVWGYLPCLYYPHCIPFLLCSYSASFDNLHCLCVEIDRHRREPTTASGHPRCHKVVGAEFEQVSQSVLPCWSGSRVCGYG